LFNFCYFALILSSMLFSVSRSEVIFQKEMEANTQSKTLLKPDLTSLHKNSDNVSLLEIAKNKSTDDGNTIQKNSILIVDSNSDKKASLMTDIGNDVRSFYAMSINKLKSLNGYIFTSDKTKSPTWVEIYFLPMLKIFGILAIIIITFLLIKFSFSKFTESIVSKSHLSSKDSKDSKVLNGDQKPITDFFKEHKESRDNIKIKGRKKKIPSNINYNDLFTNIKSEREPTVTQDKDNDTSLTIEEFFDKVKMNEKYMSQDHTTLTEQLPIRINNCSLKNSKGDLLFFDNTIKEDEEESLMLSKQIKEMDKAKQDKDEIVERHSSSSLTTLNERLRNKEIFQQTLISRCIKDSSHN